jgi:ABC-2 type transport system permease protein
MNAPAENMATTPRSHAVAVPHPTRTFQMLLKREFWEHKGGFLWTPLIAGAVFLLFNLMAGGVGEMMLSKVDPSKTIQVDGKEMRIDMLNLGVLTDKLDPKDMAELGQVVNIGLYAAASWAFIVFAFVVFFYCLGSLYDERKDRSVLFWKSLPVSDAQTVLSKVVSAVMVAPTLAVFAGVVTMLGFMLVASIFILLHGGNPFTLLFGLGDPLTVIGHLIAAIPVYALWALPTVGWLMLCSAWAKSKPFLWAIMIPLFAGIFVTWFDVMNLFNLESSWFWQHIVVRSLLSAVPGAWVNAAEFNFVKGHTSDVMTQLVNLKTLYSPLLTPQLWIGVVAGAAMIYGAIRLRRWRDEG